MASRWERIAAWLKKVENQKNLARFTGDTHGFWTGVLHFCLGVCVCVCLSVLVAVFFCVEIVLIYKYSRYVYIIYQYFTYLRRCIESLRLFSL